MISVQVTVTIDNNRVVDSQVYIGPNNSYFMGGERKDEKLDIETHRKASIVYDRVLDFAEQIRKA